MKTSQSEWEVLASATKAAAGWCCQACGLAHGSTYPSGAAVVLTVAHLDQNPENNRPQNLKVLCVRCHFRHDASFNRMRRKYGRRFHLYPQGKLWP